MALTYLVCSKCVGRRTVNNIMMKVNSKFMLTTVPTNRPLAYTRWPIFVSASLYYTADRHHAQLTYIFLLPPPMMHLSILLVLYVKNIVTVQNFDVIPGNQGSGNYAQKLYDTICGIINNL
jgi:hypothetical protein